MTSKQSRQYKILVDKGYGVATSGGFRANPFELRGAEFEIEYGPNRDRRPISEKQSAQASYVADSVQELQNAGLIQAPTYMLMNGRIHELDDFTWERSFLGLGERIFVNIPARRYGIPGGEYVVDIQNGGIIIPRPIIIRTYTTPTSWDRFRINNKDKDTLFGEKHVYQWDGKKLRKAPVQIFGSYEDFEDASSQSKFLANMPIYAVLRRREAVQKIQTGEAVREQLDNPDLVIPSGGRNQLRELLYDRKGNPRLDKFNSSQGKYEFDDRVNFLLFGYLGICSQDPDESIIGGRVVGIAPEALELRKKLGQMGSLETRLQE